MSLKSTLLPSVNFSECEEDPLNKVDLNFLTKSPDYLNELLLKNKHITHKQSIHSQYMGPTKSLSEEHFSDDFKFNTGTVNHEQLFMSTEFTLNFFKVKKKFKLQRNSNRSTATATANTNPDKLDSLISIEDVSSVTNLTSNKIKKVYHYEDNLPKGNINNDLYLVVDCEIMNILVLQFFFKYLMF